MDYSCFGKSVPVNVSIPKCKVYLNGQSIPIKEIWDQFQTEITIDTEGGEWSYPDRNRPLYVNSLDQTTGKMIETCVKRLYRQYVEELLIHLYFNNGKDVIITRQHHLLTEKGWSNHFTEIQTVTIPRVAVQQQSIKSIGLDLVTFLGWHQALGTNHLTHPRP